LAIDLCELRGEVHARGGVLRDLHPRLVVRGEDRTWLTDIGLGRVDILSTRTAASLLLEGSPYAAPEQLQRTALDPRADLYRSASSSTARSPASCRAATARRSWSTIRWRRRSACAPSCRPRSIAWCCAASSATRSPPGQRARAGGGAARRARPSTATPRAGPLSALQRAAAPRPAPVPRVRPLAVDFAAEPDGGTHSPAARRQGGHDFLARLYDTPEPAARRRAAALNFVIGDARMYSKAELERRHALPLKLFEDLSRPTAEALRKRLTTDGFAVRVFDHSRAAVRRRQLKAAAWIWGPVVLLNLFLDLVIGDAPRFVLWAIVAIGALVHAGVHFGLAASAKKKKPALLRLRAAPAALPASDPLVAQLAALLNAGTSKEIREIVGGLALAVQRLVDHRAARPGAAAEIAALTAPVAPLVALICEHVTRLQQIDRALADLDEGALVRALAACEARGEPPERNAELLAGLDQLRALEDERGLLLHRLLDTDNLLRRAVDLGLEIRDDDADHTIKVAHAVHALGPAEP
jgi:hypothetical protein